VARRCVELLRGMPTSAEDDLRPAASVSEEVTAGMATAVAYRAHKKEVLADAIDALGGGLVNLPLPGAQVSEP
jgi:hypothetical protein